MILGEGLTISGCNVDVKQPPPGKQKLEVCKNACPHQAKVKAKLRGTNSMKIQSLLYLETQTVAIVCHLILSESRAGNSAKAFCLTLCLLLLCLPE